MEATECGAAALGIVLAHFGSHVPAERLREDCGVSRDGSKANNMIRAGRRYGLVCKGFKTGPAKLRELPMPCILHWNFNHFLVLEGFHKGKVYLNDPATGPRIVTEEELDHAFTGVVLTFETGPEYTPLGDKPSLLPSMAQRLQGSHKGLLFVLLVGLALVIPGLLIPVFTRVFVDEVLVAGHETWLRPLLLGMGITALARGVLVWLQTRYLLRLSMKLAISMSGQFLWHVLRLPVPFFEARHAGDIANRVQINDRLAGLLSSTLTRTVLDLILAVFYFGLMLFYDWLLAFVVVAVAAVNIVVIRTMSRTRADQSLQVQQEHGKLMGIAMGGIQMIESMKASGGEDDFFSKWSGQHAKVMNAEQKMAVSSQIIGSVPSLLTALNTTAILGLGALRVMDGNLTVGMLVAFQSLMLSFIGPINGIVRFADQLQTFRGDLNRLDDVLAHEEDPVTNNLQDSHLGTARLSGAIKIESLSFGYSRLSPPIIEDFSIDLKPGSRVALVGGSGSGKSTVARLVAGLRQPWEGRILFDGKSREEIPRPLLSSSLAVVDQDICLFEGTVRDNLTMWDETISDEDVTRAAKDACIHDDIVLLPGGYEGIIQEGGRNLSGGQRQRMEIARALTRGPAALILDEATSALDTATEQIIDRNLRRRGCTCLIVAHRLSTIRDCDEIIVLDRGVVVERGTHESLWEAQGHYASLVGSM